MAKIFVVDDDPDMLALICAALQRDGHQVDTEADPTAVTPKRCRFYDLLLFDIMMPKEDGFSLIRRVRTEVDCPILFLTAKTGDAALVQGLGLGADDYIKKPFSLAELSARVNAHLRREKRQPTHALIRGDVHFDLQAKMVTVKEHSILFTKGDGFRSKGKCVLLFLDLPGKRRKFGLGGSCSLLQFGKFCTEPVELFFSLREVLL